MTPRIGLKNLNLWQAANPLNLSLLSASSANLRSGDIDKQDLALRSLRVIVLLSVHETGMTGEPGCFSNIDAESLVYSSAAFALGPLKHPAP